ncbi:MAG: DUF2092 domain-containing protein [Planctomycetota bacterium JB042]
MRLGPGTLLVALGATAVCLMGSSSEGGSAEPAVDPEATAVIEAMCGHLTSLRAFRFETESSEEEVLENGQKLLFTQRSTATVQRPRQIHVHVEGDVEDRTYWLDGRTLSVADHGHEVHATVEVPETIDAAMDHLAERYAMSLPLADLFSSDPLTLFTERVRSGFHAGLHSVDGNPCHHLAFRQDEVDWQIWVDAGEVPVPRRIVITYKNEPGHPQYTATIRDLRKLDAVDPATFAFEAPEGYEQIEVFEHETEEGGR